MNDIIQSSAACANGNKLYASESATHFLSIEFRSNHNSDPIVQWNVHTNTKNYIYLL